MKNDIFYKCAIVIALIIAIIPSYNYYKINNPAHPVCNVDIEFISNTVESWMKERVSENFLKTNKLEIVEMKGFAEYNTIPQWDNVPLYEDFKYSTVCKATTVVDLSPTSDDQEETDVNIEKSNKYLEEISIRYQLIGGGNIRMSGVDVEDMSKQLKEATNKYMKK